MLQDDVFQIFTGVSTHIVASRIVTLPYVLWIDNNISEEHATNIKSCHVMYTDYEECVYPNPQMGGEVGAQSDSIGILKQNLERKFSMY
jgi:hypothetical protein